MPQRTFRRDPDAYSRHYCTSGAGSLPYFKGDLVQRGYGNVFGSLLRTILPLVKELVKSPIGKEIGKQAMRTGRELFGDIFIKKRGGRKRGSMKGAKGAEMAGGADIDSGKRVKKRKRVDLLGEY